MDIELSPSRACFPWPPDYGPPDDEKLAHWVRKYTRSFQPGRPSYDIGRATIPLVTKAVVRSGANVLAVWEGASELAPFPR